MSSAPERDPTSSPPPDPPPPEGAATSRRGFLVVGGAALLSGVAAEAQPVKQAPQPGPAPTAPPGQAPAPGEIPSPSPQGYVFFTDPEVQTVTAMVARLIPADDLGPGAVDAGVVTFLDRQLGGQYGAGARWYRQGPWMAGTPSQGWQLAQAPAQIYRSALLAFDRWCQGNREARFNELAAKDQDEVLTMLEAGKIDLGGVPSSTFFQLLWQNTVEGYFADPLYGGNRNMAAWRMINFPGANPVLTEAVGLNGELYRIDPVAIGG